jgi:hypothetical protein
MAWSSLNNRLTSLPLLIAGPIVRRVEASNVSVWFVLKEDRNVTLKIYDQSTGGTLVLTGNRSSGVKIGDHVFVYCVTASSSGFSLSSATNYYYDIDFESGNTLSGLISGGLDLTFDGSNRPSFALPPDDLNQVRLVHGSCRKPHGEGYDAMKGVHDIISQSVSASPVSLINPIERPHQLFLTGDQIYADDVADVLLFMINDAASVLFGWDEDAYITTITEPEVDKVFLSFLPEELAPGQRNTNDRLRNAVGFTGMLPNKPEYSKSHLLKFREYATMYLFVWSDVLWPADNPQDHHTLPLDDGNWPSFHNVFPGKAWRAIKPTPDQKRFENDKEHIKRFKLTITKIRKALANIPTYMIFDDHEITDDWNLNWQWCREVYSRPLGRRTVQNGLLAYALFQAWGNTPDQFNESEKKKLLGAVNAWRGEDDGNYKTIASLLNIPKIIKNSDISDFPHESAIFYNWHFDIQSSRYAVYFQDSRTWRGYPREWNKPINFAKLITQAGYEYQLPENFPEKDIILIIAPCPVIGVPFIEENQKNKQTWDERCDLDTEAWSLDEDGFQRLFSNLVSRLPVAQLGASSQRSGRFAFLSGDVHYAFSSRYQLWGNSFLGGAQTPVSTQAIFAQLTASAFKNQTLFSSSIEGLKTTQVLHERGYPHSILEGGVSLLSPIHETRALPEPSLNFAWVINGNPIVGKFKSPTGTPSGLLDYGPVSNGLLVRSIKQLAHDHLERITVNPNWLYRIDWILGENTKHRIALLKKIETLPLDIKLELLNAYKESNQNLISYIETWGPGKEIVGVNTFGEINFHFTGDNKYIDHILWWRMEKISERPSQVKLLPLTTYKIPMNYTGDKDHEKNPYSQPTYSGL